MAPLNLAHPVECFDIFLRTLGRVLYLSFSNFNPPVLEKSCLKITQTE